MSDVTPQNEHEDVQKDATPSPTLPDLDGVPEDDSAEPEDAEVEHLASEEEVLDEEQQRRAAARAQHYPESDDEE